MYFFLDLARARAARDAYQTLALGALAAQGSSKSIRDQLRQLKKNMR